jgi:hypothetical protein
MPVKHLRFTIRNTDTGRVLKRIKCNVSGASYNVQQRARNCISDAVSRLGCEEGVKNWGAGVVNVRRCYRKGKLVR